MCILVRHRLRMNSLIKKLLIYLGSLCLISILVEETVNQLQAKGKKTRTSHFMTPRKDRLEALKSLRESTTPSARNVSSTISSTHDTHDLTHGGFNDSLNIETVNSSIARLHEFYNLKTDTLRNLSDRSRSRLPSNVEIIKNDTTKEEYVAKSAQAKSNKIKSSTTGVTAKIFNSTKHVNYEANILDESETRRLKSSPFIYLEDGDGMTQQTQTEQTTVKLVALYTPAPRARVPSDKRFRNCPYHKCTFVNDLSSADAVMFRASYVRDHGVPVYNRPPGQRWIFHTMDPAVKGYNLASSLIKDKFNWTLTYQLDSDIPIIFGHLRKRPLPDSDFEKIYQHKDRDVAWFVSHCDTWGLRELYVQRMRKVMEVDIFGGCGNLTCGNRKQYGINDARECLPMLSQRYKFYLAFENSFCKDYISEKFFKLFKNVDVIPVVRGGFDYKKYLPSGIFVDAADFKTPEDLAKYLLELGRNQSAYVAMLKRKNTWVMAQGQRIFCQVCQALHTAPPTPHFYPDLYLKFNGVPSFCWHAPDLGLAGSNRRWRKIFSGKGNEQSDAAQ